MKAIYNKLSTHILEKYILCNHFVFFKTCSKQKWNTTSIVKQKNFIVYLNRLLTKHYRIFENKKSNSLVMGLYSSIRHDFKINIWTKKH